MEYSGLVIGFLSGVLLTIFAAYVNTTFSKNSKNDESLKKAEYEIYLKLSDLYNWYFWLATNELHQRETTDEIIDTISDIAIDIAKQLHKYEESEFTHELLQILYDESYKTYDARWKHMSELSKKMSKKITPLHNVYLNQLSEKNIHLMAKEGFKPKAPASSRFRMGV